MFAYAVGGVWSGSLADYISKKKYIFVCYSIIGVTGIVLGLQQYWTTKGEGLVGLSSGMQVISGLAQSMGWGTNIAILTNWFPKKGRGLLIGIWASNANIGDIIGSQLYRMIAGNSHTIWGTPLIVIGCATIVLGFINLLVLYEFPIQKGYKINEN